jgi:hypothetical protein
MGECEVLLDCLRSTGRRAGWLAKALALLSCPVVVNTKPDTVSWPLRDALANLSTPPAGLVDLVELGGENV